MVCSYTEYAGVSALQVEHCPVHLLQKWYFPRSASNRTFEICVHVCTHNDVVTNSHPVHTAVVLQSHTQYSYWYVKYLSHPGLPVSSYTVSPSSPLGNLFSKFSLSYRRRLRGRAATPAEWCAHIQSTPECQHYKWNIVPCTYCKSGTSRVRRPIALSKFACTYVHTTTWSRTRTPCTPHL